MKRIFAIITAMFLMLALFALAACGSTEEPGVSGGETGGGTGGGGTPPPAEEELPEQEEFPEQAITLASVNKTNTATAHFHATYSDTGITLEAYVEDDDIKADIFYSSGYDDNIEYLIGTKYDGVTGWEAGKTLHFLISADGDTTLQRANSSNTFGADYALDLLCVNGVNFGYTHEYTEYGYKNTVFIGYDLLGTDAESGRGNIYVCPAMRNTHDYADTTWTPFAEGGCDWNNASTFIRVDEEKGYDLARAMETDVLFLGDSQLYSGYWLTYGTDMNGKKPVNLAAAGMRIADWRQRIPAVADYAPESIVVYAGSDEIASKEGDEIAEELGGLLGALREGVPAADVYVVTLTGSRDASLGAKVAAANAGIAAAATENGATLIDAAARLSENGVLKAGFAAADGKHLNQLGFNVLSSLIRGALGIGGETSEAFGDGSVYASSVAVKDENGVAVLDGPKDQYTYFEGCGDEEFYAKVEISAQTVYNSDAYPKFGIVLTGEDTTLFFYFDGGNSLTNQKVGYVAYVGNNTWNWEESVEAEHPVSYANGS